MHDVLIAGAGPAGLFLGLQLVRSGRSVRLVEQNAGQSEHSKALAIVPRTMELFRIAGIAAPFETAAHRVTGASYIVLGHPVTRVPYEPKATWYDYVAMVPQNVTERILYDAFVAAGGSVEYETRLVGLLDAPDRVTVRLQSPRGEETATARYVVGCDGIHSAVRDLIGFGFEGEQYQDAYVLFDVDTVGDSPAADILVCNHSDGPLAVFPISAKRRRVIAMYDHDAASAPSLDLANELLGARGPWNLGATRLHWSSSFRIGHRQSPGMHKGSVFLAGDSAHVHSPFGGQGMNTGLGDAFNLAWKLDYTLAGFANNDLLPSYSQERLRVASEVIRATDIGTRVMTTKNALLRGVRDWAMPGLLDMKRLQQAFIERFSGLAINYAQSRIVEGSGRRAADELVRAGERERRLYDVLDRRYLLVYPASSPISVAEAFENFASHYGGALGVVSSDSPGLPLVRLVRPDGYLALETASADDPTPALEKLTRVLATHVRRVGRSG